MRYFILLILFSFSLSLFPKNVNKTKAIKVAENFITLNSENADLDTSNCVIISENNMDLIYVFSFINSNGFIMLSASEAAYPVLGYSFTDNFVENNYPENFQAWLDSYKSQIKFIKKNNLKAGKEIAEEWSKLENNIQTKAAPVTVGPLLSSIWGQGCGYNALCPADASGQCGHVVTGCVATAMGQVINYHSFPPNGSGIHSYNSNYGILTADFGNTNYDWQNMADTLTSTSDSLKILAVAELISHCGIAVDMNYSPGASGAYSADAATAFTQYFNFSDSLTMIQKSNYSDSAWIEILKLQIDSLMPMYYSGTGSGGHAFVCDGYSTDGFFHFNWGWNSYNNGFFHINTLNPGGMNFSIYQSAIINIKPKTPGVCSGNTDTLTSHFGNISDGSSYLDYQNNANCSWLINPPNVQNIELEFFNFNLANGDSLFIYDGNSNSSSLLAAYHKNSSPSVLLSSSNNLFIEFISDNSLVDKGWSAAYQSNYCSSQTVLTSISDTFSDGSGANYNYKNNSNCEWLIHDSLGRPINLVFTQFKTEQAYDYVYVYDGNSTSANLLGSYDGNTMPPDLTSTAGDMLVKFISDGGVTDEGWEAYYYICNNPAFSISNSDSVSICQGDSITFSSAYSNLDWYFNSGFIGSSDSLTANNPGSYYAVNNGFTNCPADTSAIVNLLVNPLPQPYLGEDTLIDKNHAIMLSTNNTYSSYLWSTGDTSSQISVDSTGMQNNQKTISVQVSDSNSCMGRDTIVIGFIITGSITDANSLILNIYPNPAKDLIYFEGEINSEYQIEIFDSYGKMVYNTNHIEGQFKIDIKGLESGVYYLKITTDKKSGQYKFVKL